MVHKKLAFVCQIVFIVVLLLTSSMAASRDLTFKPTCKNIVIIFFIFFFCYLILFLFEFDNGSCFFSSTIM